MSIEDFIDQISSKDFTSAQNTFGDVMRDRMQDALDQEKAALAGTLFGEEEEVDEDDDQLEMDFDEDDEELEDESAAESSDD